MCLSQPKVPKPTPVIERQPYKNPAPFDSYASGTDADARRRMIAGVVTGSQGDTSIASTTANPQANQALGGGQATDQIGGGATASPGSSLGGGGSVSAPSAAPQTTPAAAKPKGRGGFLFGAGLGLNPGFLASVQRQQRLTVS